MSSPFWIVVPYLNCWEMTRQAIEDFLAQSGLPSPPQILAIDTGSTREVRAEMEAWMEREPRLHAWFHRPGLPSLSAAWNLGLRFVWEQGGEVALVVNNDVRLHPETYACLWRVQHGLDALFVSAVGVREEQFPGPDEVYDQYYWASAIHDGPMFNKGGPDFSCFLLTKEGHTRYPFDEGIRPAYTEDCDCHRRYMLGGDGERIFSVNLPYLHYGSATVNADPSQRQRWADRLKQSRAYYQDKWGGDVNAERYTIPFEAQSDQDGVTNPELQARILHAPAADPAR